MPRAYRRTLSCDFNTPTNRRALAAAPNAELDCLMEAKRKLNYETVGSSFYLLQSLHLSDLIDRDLVSILSTEVRYSTRNAAFMKI